MKNKAKTTAGVYIKNNIYQVVITYQDKHKVRKQKWISTGIKANERNAKEKAEELKEKYLEEWKAKTALPNFEDILFSNFLSFWLEETKIARKNLTNKDYGFTINGAIKPYFSSLGIKLADLKTHHIQNFYSYASEVKKVGNNTIRHYHAYIHRCLDYAVRMEYIISNPAKNAILPRKERPITKYIEKESDIKLLLQRVKGDVIEPVIVLAIYLGLRRGEIAGLKWDCINFDKGVLSIKGTLTPQKEYIDEAKNDTSIRSFPLSEVLKDYLLKLKEKQEANKRDMGKRYNTIWEEFVCVKDNGDIIPPDYMSRRVHQVCKKYGFDVKLHELRHTNISLLINAGNDIKIVSEWAGHSSIQTTADIYAHISTDRKRVLADSISIALE